METPAVGRIEFDNIKEIKDGFRFFIDNEREIRKYKDEKLTRFLSTALEAARNLEDCFEKDMIIERLEDSLSIINAA